MSVPEKTPVPNSDVLGMPIHGSSWSIPTIQPYCPCGRPIGVYEYTIAQMRAELDSRDPADLYKKVKERFEFKMCCANLVLNRVIRTVVISDIGAFVNNDEMRDAPMPKTYSLKTFPPPLIAQSRNL